MTTEEIEPVSAVNKKRMQAWQACLINTQRETTQAIVSSFDRVGEVANENLARVRKEHDEESSLQDRKLQILRENNLIGYLSCLRQLNSPLSTLPPSRVQLINRSTTLG